LIGAGWLGQAAKVAAYLTAAREVGSGGLDGAWSNRVLAVSSARHLNVAQLERWVRALGAKESTPPDHALFGWAKAASNQPTPVSFERQMQSIAGELRETNQAASGSAETETFGDFSGPDFTGWSVEDEAFGTSPSLPGDFVVGDGTRSVLALLAEPAANSASVSRRLEGVLRSPTFTIRKRYAHILASGSGCRVNVRVDDFTMIRDPDLRRSKAIAG